MEQYFEAIIYKVGINWCVDVPTEITRDMVPDKGYIKVKGKINSSYFTKTLVPVKNAPYRLFVNAQMMKEGKTALGEVASFVIEQDFETTKKNYTLPDVLLKKLTEKKLMSDFDNLSNSRKREILKYLSYIKTEETLNKNIHNLIEQLENKQKNVRIP